MNHDTISTRLDVKETSLIEPDAQKIPVASLVWEKMATTVSIITMGLYLPHKPNIQKRLSFVAITTVMSLLLYLVLLSKWK